MGMHTLLSLKWIINKDLLSSTWSSAQCGSLDGRGVWRIDTCMCGLSPFTASSPETITTVLIGYTLIQNRKLFKK